MVGASCGAALGFLSAALCISAKRADEELDRAADATRNVLPFKRRGA